MNLLLDQAAQGGDHVEVERILADPIFSPLEY